MWSETVGLLGQDRLETQKSVLVLYAVVLVLHVWYGIALWNTVLSRPPPAELSCGQKPPRSNAPAPPKVQRLPIR